MISLSPGYLHSAFKLLEMVSTREHELSVLAKSIPRIELLPGSQVVNFTLAMGWVHSDDLGKAVMTPAGALVYELPSAPHRFRQALLDYIGMAQPAWSQLTTRGRQETLSALPVAIWQCFAEAGLTRSYSDDVVSWWDKLAARARGQRSEILSETGRKGEKLSLAYEYRRTGKEPKWQAIESNLSGFDILSVVAHNDLRKLQIEVKTTEAGVKSSHFHITKYEWEAADLAEGYTFHLWSLDGEIPLLAVVDRDAVDPHIPANRGAGEWENVEVPFAAFRSHFSTSAMVSTTVPE